MPLRRQTLALLRPGYRFLRSLSPVGLILGTLFFAASLTPSLIPRDLVVQGVLSGLSLAAGYGIGVGLRALWAYLGFVRAAQSRGIMLAKLVAAIVCAGLLALALWQASEAQNSIRRLMDMPDVETARPFSVAAIAAAVFLTLMLIGRLFVLLTSYTARRLRRRVPPRVANLSAVALVAALFWSVGNGILVEAGFRALDSTYRQLDRLLPDDMAAPEDPRKSGSADSHLAWDDLGRTGRDMVAAGPTAEDIEAFTGEPALEPLRVYVGLNSADTPQERAELALAELERIDAFDRSVLLVNIPTGTGWVDPKAQMPVEYLHRGDIATVSVQYSYLASWLALLVDPDYGAESARALFDAVYDRWRSLPPQDRPELYLHGLSLGAMNSDLSADLFQVIRDPFDGAFWAGPPFTARSWSQITARRTPDSPAWLPRFRDGGVVRFTSQENKLDRFETAWGPPRIAFLQYASDPITFFEPQSLYRPPEWMTGERGPDVSPRLEWYPVVTFLQLVLDMMTATSTPMGYGHVFAPAHYIDGWDGVTEPENWSDSDIDRLKTMLTEKFADQE